MSGKHINSFWISLSDIMTALMMIFMFIAISYIMQIQDNQKKKNYLIKHFKETNSKLFEELKDEFLSDFNKTNLNIEIDKDLSIKFLDEKVLFDYNEATIKDEFKKILDDFFPRYISILLQDKYRDNISEIRIEGHSDSEGDYMYNMRLSQKRTTAVLEYILFNKNSEFYHLDENYMQYIRHWTTATGNSSGRTIDSSGNFTFTTLNKEDKTKSRRVEFRIITRSNEIIDKFLDQ